MTDKASFYKYKSLDNFEFLMDILLKERLYAASYHELNDPMEGVIKIDNTVPKSREAEWEEIVSQLRIVCFTRDYENTLMWSHYADGGKGCVIEFELLDDQKHHKVSYLVRPTLTAKDINDDKAIEILKYKNKPWKYEAEYRCIIPNEHFLPVRIKSITFGPRAKPESVDMLGHILSLCKPNLKVQHHGGFGIFKGAKFIIGAKRTFVRTLDPDECSICASNKLARQDFVGMHRNWQSYEDH